MKNHNTALNLLDDSVRRGERLDVPKASPSKRFGNGHTPQQLALPIPLDEDAPTTRQRRAWAKKITSEPREPGKLNASERAVLERLIALGYEIAPGYVHSERTGQRQQVQRRIRPRKNAA